MHTLELKINDKYINRVLEIMSQKDVYKSYFDVFHLAFSEYYGCKEFITFDKGFKRFKDLSKTQIVIL